MDWSLRLEIGRGDWMQWSLCDSEEVSAVKIKTVSVKSNIFFLIFVHPLQPGRLPAAMKRLSPY
jgi:hypothetical protein